MVHSLTYLILKRKNVLSKVWLAAHWDKKLTRYHIFQIDIERCIKDIIYQEIILDLRLSGHLLVGIVKIFSRKTKYLLNECTEIISKVRIFRADLMELPPRKLTAPLEAITLPEIFEKGLELNKLDDADIFGSFQSNVEEITLKETALDSRLINDDEHFDIFGEENVPMDFEENIQLATLLNDGDDKACQIPKDTEATFAEDYCNGVEARNGSSDSSDDLLEEEIKQQHVSDSQELVSQLHHVSDSQQLIFLYQPDKIPKPKDYSKLNLEPLSNNFNNIQRLKKHKRRLIIDEVKSISREKIEKQVQDFSDVVAPLDMAPPSKRLMILKEIGNAEQLLHRPGLKITNTKIGNLFKRNLRNYKNEEKMTDDSTSGEESDLSSQLEGPRGKLFLDDCGPEICFDQQNGLSHELNHQHELLNEDGLLDNALNSDSSNNDVGCFIEKKEHFAEEMELSIEVQQDSGCSSNGISNICQDKIIKLLQKLKLLFREGNEIKFSNLVQNDRKIEVAQKFHSMLMIKKFNIVEIKQAEPYREIFLTKGTNFVVACEEIY